MGYVHGRHCRGTHSCALKGLDQRRWDLCAEDACLKYVWDDLSSPQPQGPWISYFYSDMVM